MQRGGLKGFPVGICFAAEVPLLHCLRRWQQPARPSARPLSLCRALHRQWGTRRRRGYPSRRSAAKYEGIDPARALHAYAYVQEQTEMSRVCEGHAKAVQLLYAAQTALVTALQEGKSSQESQSKGGLPSFFRGLRGRDPAEHLEPPRRALIWTNSRTNSSPSHPLLTQVHETPNLGHV